FVEQPPAGVAADEPQRYRYRFSAAHTPSWAPSLTRPWLGMVNEVETGPQSLAPLLLGGPRAWSGQTGFVNFALRGDDSRRARRCDCRSFAGRDEPKTLRCLDNRPTSVASAALGQSLINR